MRSVDLRQVQRLRLSDKLQKSVLVRNDRHCAFGGLHAVHRSAGDRSRAAIHAVDHAVVVHERDGRIIAVPFDAFDRRAGDGVVRCDGRFQLQSFACFYQRVLR